MNCGFTLSDVKCERSSICRIELSLASNDCNEWQVFNTFKFWILLLEILSMTRFCKVLRPKKNVELGKIITSGFFLYNQLNQENYWRDLIFVMFVDD